MTHVLKLDEGHGASVRALDVQSPLKAPSAEERRIAALQEEVDELQQALRDAGLAHQADVVAAREEGRKQAVAEFQHDEERALARLSTGLREAMDRLNQHFANADRLGLALALAALERIVADPSLYRKLIAEAIGVQVIGLRQDTIVSIQVSGDDFKDAAALNNLAAALGSDTAIAANASLKAGECRIELRLGAIDISLPDYWERLQAQCRRLLLDAP